MSKSASKILTTAEQLFYQYSFGAVGVDFIRDQSGCSKTTLYTHFDNKEKLIQAVLKKRDQVFQENLVSYVAEAQGMAAIERIFDWHMHWFMQDHFKGCLFLRAVAEANNEQVEIIEICQQHKQQIKALIGIHCMSQHIAECIYTLIEGLMSRFLVDGYDPKVAECIKQQIHILFNLQCD